MRLLGSVVLTTLLTTGLATTALAQDEASRRDGFWIGFGLGAGWNTSDGLNDDSRGGGAGYLRLGGTISPHVLLGGEVMGWGRSNNDVTVGRGNATFTAMIYPSRTGGFYAKGGLGVSSVGLTVDGPGSTSLSASETGFGSTRVGV